MGRWIFIALVLSAAVSTPSFAQSVTTYHNTPNRAGLYTVPGLTLAAAAKLHLAGGFHASVIGNVYAQPLYWQPPGKKKGYLIVATESNWVYALNADTGAEIWKTHVAESSPESMFDCGNIDPEGITGTPVIDAESGTLYLNAMTLTGSNTARHKVYALSLSDGKILPHWPIDVEAAMGARHADFSSHTEHDRSALQFFKGKLYVNYSGRGGDCDTYHGIVIEFDPSSRTATGSWATRAPSGGGIWAQGGLASDGTSLYATTGNTFGATHWQDGEAVIRLRPGLARSSDTKDYFTPKNWKTLDNQDADLGGTGAVPFTVPTASGVAHRILALGKNGRAYLLNAANLGGFAGALATLQVSNSAIVTEPAIYPTPSAALVAFTNRDGATSGCSGTTVMMLKIVTGGSPISVAWCGPMSGGGAPIVTTTDGSANPIVWATGAQGDNQLHGFNALTGKPVFQGGVTMSGLHRYGTLIAANRHLYVAADGTVYAFTF